MLGTKVVKLNKINVKMASCIKKMNVFSISLLICASSFWRLLQSIIYNVFIMLVDIILHDALICMCFVSEWSYILL